MDDVYSGTIASILALFAFFVGAMLSIAIKKAISQWKESASRRTDAFNKLVINRITRDGNIELVKKLRRWDDLALRNMLADMGVEARGREGDRLRALYRRLGYHVDDLRLLRHPSSNKRLRAINRLEKLKMEIPFDQHILLLSDPHSTVRMLAMILLIQHHKKRSTPYLISFIERKAYERKGYLFFILQELGRVDRRALYFLFERAFGDADFEEALLISAYQSPPMRFDEIIYRKLTKGSAPFVIVWALKVLSHYPSAKLLKTLRILRNHPFWAVRLQVARSLAVFAPDVAVEFLPQFLKDSNYLVRLEASRLAVNTKSCSSRILSIVSNDQQHPSQDIVKYLMAIEELKAA